MSADGSMAEVVARRSQAGRPKASPLPFVLVGLVCAVAGCLCGAVFFGGGAAGSSLSEGAVASFSYGGETREIGQKELQKLNVGFDVSEGEAPDSADILDAVRMDVLSQEARNQGIAMTDEDIASYAQTWYGTDDYAFLGGGVLDAQEVKDALEQKLLVDSLRKEKSSGEEVQQPPASPEYPSGGPEAESVPSAEYGSYLIGLFGEAYDPQSDSWVQLDSPFYEAFKDESFSSGEATYEQAMKGYFTAYSLYDIATSGSDDAWTSYVDEVMSGVQVVLHGVGK